MQQHIKDKIKQTKKDELLYRQHRYKREAIPTITAVTLFAILQLSLISVMITSGVAPAIASVLSTLVSSIISYPIYADIKMHMAAKGKAFLEEHKITREGDPYAQNLYPHFIDNNCISDTFASSYTYKPSREQSGKYLPINIEELKSSSMQSSEHNNQYWQTYIDSRTNAADYLSL